MADIILCWVFWIIGGQVDAEAGGGGGRQGQGEHQVPRVPANKLCEKNCGKRAVPRRTKIVVSVAVLPKGGRLQASPTLHQGEVHTKTTHGTRLCHELDYPYF